MKQPDFYRDGGKCYQREPDGTVLEIPETTYEAMLAVIGQRDQAQRKAVEASATGIRFAVSPAGGLAIYGLQSTRPIVVFAGQLARLCDRLGDGIDYALANWDALAHSKAGTLRLKREARMDKAYGGRKVGDWRYDPPGFKDGMSDEQRSQLWDAAIKTAEANEASETAEASGHKSTLGATRDKLRADQPTATETETAETAETTA